MRAKLMELQQQKSVEENGLLYSKRLNGMFKLEQTCKVQCLAFKFDVTQLFSEYKKYEKHLDQLKNDTDSSLQSEVKRIIDAMTVFMSFAQFVTYPVWYDEPLKYYLCLDVVQSEPENVEEEKNLRRLQLEVLQLIKNLKDSITQPFFMLFRRDERKCCTVSLQLNGEDGDEDNKKRRRTDTLQLYGEDGNEDNKKRRRTDTLQLYGEGGDEDNS